MFCILYESSNSSRNLTIVDIASLQVTNDLSISEVSCTISSIRSQRWVDSSSLRSVRQTVSHCQACWCPLLLTIVQAISISHLVNLKNSCE